MVGSCIACSDRMRSLRDVGKTVGLAGLAGVTLAVAVHVATYFRWRERCLGWDATPDERRLALPGDDLLLEPDIVSTRAVTVDAPVEHVWPWLVQMGPGRGGAYTHDWIENLFGLGMHSADEILPQHQRLTVGRVPAGRSRSRAPHSCPRAATCPGHPIRRRQLDLGVLPTLGCVRDEAHQPEPDRDTRSITDEASDRTVPDGAGKLDHGTQDARGYQTPSRATSQVSPRTVFGNPAPVGRYRRRHPVLSRLTTRMRSLCGVKAERKCHCKRQQRSALLGLIETD
jgi:hypothetical protein